MKNYFGSMAIIITMLYVANYLQVPYLSTTLYVVLFFGYCFMAMVAVTLMCLSLGKISRNEVEKVKDLKLLLKAGNAYLKNYWFKEVIFAVFSITQFSMIIFNPTYTPVISLMLLVPSFILTASTIIFKNETIKLVKSLDKDTNGSN
jgi:hypothetical protein